MEAAKRYFFPWAAFLLTFVVYLTLFHVRNPHLGYHYVFRRSGLGDALPALMYCFSFCVVATMLHPQSYTTRLLELRPLRYLGRLSYSLYLWHILFFNSTVPLAHMTWAPLVLLSQRPYRYFAALLCAMASYHWIEKPLIRVGHRLAPPSTPGHRDLEAQPVEMVREESGD